MVWIQQKPTHVAGMLVAPPTILIDAISEGIIACLYARSRTVALNTAGSGVVRTHSTIALRDPKFSIAEF